MAKSLQEQLLRSGLASDQQLRKAKTEKRSKRKRGQQADDAGTKQAAVEASQNKAARDRELNAQRQHEAEQRAEQARLRQLVEAHAVPRESGDTAYRFSDGERVASLYLDEKLRAGVIAGRLAIARLGEDYHVVTEAGAERLAKSYPQSLVVWHRPESSAQDDDDPYAGYEVPDDLMW